MSRYDYMFRIMLIGDSGVGKTSIMIRFTDDAFVTDFISTIGIDFKIRTIIHKGKTVKLHIWDTAGQERFRCITNTYYRSAHGVMLIYDITARKSFENVKMWIKNIAEQGGIDVVKLIVGNKLDKDDYRQVTIEEGKQLAVMFNSSFMEISAKQNINVEEAFVCIMNEIYLKISDLQSNDLPKYGAALSPINVNASSEPISKPTKSTCCPL